MESGTIDDKLVHPNLLESHTAISRGNLHHQAVQLRREQVGRRHAR
jgi:hypothetical protein